MAGYLGAKPAVNGIYTVDEFTSSGGTTYTLSRAPGNKNNIQVNAGGLAQYPSAYSVSGTTLTLSGVPSGQKVVVRHMGETILYPALDDDIVTTAKIATDAVTTAKIAAGAVGTTDIADDAVTGAKLNPALVAGDVIYADGTDTINRLAKGTAAQVLTMNGGATAPEWADAGGGMHTQIGSTQTLTGQGSCNFEGNFTSTYKTYLIRLENVTVSTNSAFIYLRVGIGDPTVYQTGSSYQYHGDRKKGSSGTHEHYNWNVGTYIRVSDGVQQNTADCVAHFEIYIYNPASTATKTLIRSIGMTHDGTDEHHHITGGAYKLATAVTAIKLYPTAGTFSGTFKLYGLS